MSDCSRARKSKSNCYSAAGNNSVSARFSRFLKFQLARKAIWEQEGVGQAEKSAKAVQTKYQEIESKLERLVNGFLEGPLDKETYRTKRDKLINTKTELQNQRLWFLAKRIDWIELCPRQSNFYSVKFYSFNLKWIIKLS